MSSITITTAEGLAAMGSAADHCELIRGELRRMSPAGLEHGIFANRVNLPLAGHVEAHGLGEVFIAETGFVVERDPDTVLAPDIAFVSAERLPPRAELARFGRLAPDLVVEVVSPSNRPGELAEKIAIYLAAGTRLVWALHPTREVVAVHRPGRPVVELGVGDALDGEDVVPGFRLPVSRIFRSR